VKWSAVPTPVRSALYLTTGIVLGMFALVLWNRFVPSKPVIDPKAEAQPATLAKRTKSLPTRKVPVQVAVVEKQEVERVLPGVLSRRSLEDNTVVVSKPREITKGWEYGYFVTPTLDTVTGEMGADVKAKPPPFVEFRKRFELEGRYLFAGANVFEADLRVLPIRFNARVGGVTIEPILFGGIEVRREDSTFGARAGVGISVKW
jgi:hypothetical protein